MVPAVATRHHPISQAAKTASPRWLLAMPADLSMRVCWASPLSTRGGDAEPTTHLCHRTCQPSQCDRCTAKAGGTSREDSLAYAHTPRSTPPPSLDHTCRRTGHSSIIKSNPSRGCRKAGYMLCRAPTETAVLRYPPKGHMDLLAPSSGGKYWHLICPRKQADRGGADTPCSQGGSVASNRAQQLHFHCPHPSDLLQQAALYTPLH